VDSWVGDQVGLEFSDINIQSTIESEGSSQRGDDLGNESVQVGVGGSFDVQLSSADVVDGFVVQHAGNISVFQQGVGGQDGVVGFNDSGGDLGGGIDGETELGLLAVIDGESFQKEGTETRSGTTSDSIEDHESLETSAIVSKLSDSVQAKINNFFTNGVMTSGKIVSGIFFS